MDSKILCTADLHDSNLQKIRSFIDLHHVMSLATSDMQELSVCSLFYVYSSQRNSFIVASSDETTHVKHLQSNNQIAGNILLETSNVGKIQGLQFRGKMKLLHESSLEDLYFKRFPYAKVMKPKLWEIDVDFFKFTDNTLGFGKKIIWKDS